MALVNSNYRESTAVKSWYDYTFRSTYDLELKPQTLGQLIYRYGPGVMSVLNFMHLAESVIPVKSPNITIFEKGAPTRPVKVTIAASADASAGVTVTPATDDDSDDYLRAGFDLVIPKSYTNKDQDVPLRLSYSAPTWTGKPYQSGVEILAGLTDIYCVLGASSFGYGTAGADPMASGTYSYQTNERILKDAAGIEGGIVYQEEYKEIAMADGSKGKWSVALAEMDFRLDDQIDSALLTSVANANTTNLTAAGIGGNTAAIPSFNGLIAEMKSKAQELDWTTAFDIDKFRAVKALLENVGIINKKVDFMVGTDLNASIETSMIDFLKAYSAGHTFYDVVRGVGFVVKEININGVQFYVNELSSFANPNKFGLASYGYRDMGFMFPQGKYSATLDMMGEKQELRIPHLNIGYPSGNGEERKRLYKIEPGVNGLQGMGDIVSNSYDGVKFHSLAHVIPIFTHMHQTILIEKDETEGAGA